METGKSMERATADTTLAHKHISNLFDISRFDTSFMDDIACLVKPKQKPAAVKK